MAAARIGSLPALPMQPPCWQDLEDRDVFQDVCRDERLGFPIQGLAFIVQGSVFKDQNVQVLVSYASISLSPKASE